MRQHTLKLKGVARTGAAVVDDQTSVQLAEELRHPPGPRRARRAHFPAAAHADVVETVALG